MLLKKKNDLNHRTTSPNVIMTTVSTDRPKRYGSKNAIPYVPNDSVRHLLLFSPDQAGRQMQQSLYHRDPRVSYMLGELFTRIGIKKSSQQTININILRQVSSTSELGRSSCGANNMLQFCGSRHWILLNTSARTRK